MSRKDYELIALCLREQKPGPAWLYPAQLGRWEAIVHAMGRCLKVDNPRFDEQRFLSACGVE